MVLEEGGKSSTGRGTPDILPAISQASVAMQVLVAFPGDPESYLKSGAERSMTPPSPCPHCGSHRKLRLLGYYERFITTTTGALERMKVRRFRCRDCRHSVSLLPNFCLSYRLVRGESVARFLRGDGIDALDLPWQELLLRCRRRFESWIPQLGELTHSAFGVHWNGLPSHLVWTGMEVFFGGWTEARHRILGKCGVTMLGAYCCHAAGVSKGDHINRLFPSGTDPPI
jgi:Domain of unknown function (DUF6431)